MEKNKQSSLRVLNVMNLLNGDLLWLGTLSVPSGLVAWMFWRQGWKIAVIGLLVVVWCVWVKTVLDAAEKKIREQEGE